MHAVIVGATGLIGSYLVSQILSDNYFNQVTVLTRKPFDIKDPKLENTVVDFNKFSELENSFQNADVLFVTVGTTQKKVKGDHAAYRKVDYDIPVNMARVAVQKGVKRFVLISSAGADPNSANFYIKLKGEVEQAIIAMGLESIYIIRPSILLGNRKETRLGEAIGKLIMKPVSALLFGPSRKYRAIEAKDVAHAMLSASKQEKRGLQLLHYDDVMKLILN